MGRTFWLFVLLPLLGCENTEGAKATKESKSPVAAASQAPTAPAEPPPPTASATKPPPPASTVRKMPPRPVPTTSPTVTIGMPEEVQLQAIQYMSAMQAPQPDDANAEPSYAAGLAKQLEGAGDKVEVVSSGRRIDISMKKGCDARTLKQIVLQKTGAALPSLFLHGVLVLRCTDPKTQCLQSTRDPNDVLCTRR